MNSFIYFNLHKKCFSIRHNGFVVAHASAVVVDEATTKVSETGRQRVLLQSVARLWDGLTVVFLTHVNLLKRLRCGE